MPFMSRKYRRGPRADPWGTPQGEISFDDKCSPFGIFCDLFFKYD